MNIIQIFDNMEDLKKARLAKKYDEEDKKTEKWHRKTFPDATLAGQLLKLEEELKEFVDAKTPKEKLKEMADVFIVLSGLKRWDSKVGNFCRHHFFDFSGDIRGWEEILKAIRRKMDINRKRTWEKSGDGRFHHSNKE